MKRSLYTSLVVISLASSVFLTGCQRSGSDFWEDTKTAGRYAGKGVYSLFGKHDDSRQVADSQEFVGPPENDYVALNSSDMYHRITMGDKKALEEITVNTPIPQSQESPGEQGSIIPGIEKFSSPDALHVSDIFSTVFFGYNDYAVINGKQLETIKNIATYMKRNPNVYIFVEGHCDERGSTKYNLALGTYRSNSIRNMLIKEGVNLNNIFTISYGKERPIAMGHDEKSWCKNRRADFKILTRS